MAQLGEQSLPMPEVQGSNPVIGKIYIEHLFTVNWVEKTKINKKRPGMAHLKNIEKLTGHNFDDTGVYANCWHLENIIKFTSFLSPLVKSLLLLLLLLLLAVADILPLLLLLLL